tara:strand:+ start:337 stop:531 length:195 start_codon:yes stop_codon:yes gene_type:complete
MKIEDYIVNHAKRGCYEVLLEEGEQLLYLTNFRNPRAAKKFIEEHKRGNVRIDPDTCIPTPDFE